MKLQSLMKPVSLFILLLIQHSCTVVRNYEEDIKTYPAWGLLDCDTVNVWVIDSSAIWYIVSETEVLTDTTTIYHIRKNFLRLK